MKFIEKLNNTDFFKKLTAAELASVIENCEYYLKNYEKEVVIKEEGETVKDLAIILQGSVTISKTLPSGKKTVVSVLAHGASFGEAIIFSSEHTYPATVTSTGNSAILYISKESLMQILLESPSLMGGYLSLLSNRILLLNSKIEELSYKSNAEKTAGFLLRENAKKQNMLFSIPYSRNQLADILGIPRPSLSRTLSRLKKEEIIDYHKNTFKILDHDALCHIVE
jgi:CRP-like cAMP-binding protein